VPQEGVGISMTTDLQFQTADTGAFPIPSRRASLAYRALVLFSLFYFFRPEDFIPGMAYLPWGKMVGAIALLGLIFGVRKSDRGKLPVECKILLVLLAHLILTIPTAAWRGGSFDTVFNKFSKGVIVALLITLVVTKMSELRKLLYIQALAVVLVTIGSMAVHRTMEGRLMGIQNGILENPNDLAINIAINFPLCLGFMFAARGGLRKSVWVVSLFCLIAGVVATYSRSGFVALVITGIICIWEFGIRGKRVLLVGGTVIFGILAVAGLTASPKYRGRIMSLIQRPAAGTVQEGSMEEHGEGSLEARSQLLKDSLNLMLHHPIFGIGPGNFPAVTGTWRVAHNTYTELGAEAGVPGLLLFVALLLASMRRIKSVYKLPGYKGDPEIRIWVSALWASITGYAAGALFASTEYNLFPYFIIGYICALYKIAAHEATNKATTPPGDGGRQDLGYVGNQQSELVWSR
jgi:O-antigen ligase